MTNPFEAMAERQISAAQRSDDRRAARAEQRRIEKAERKLSPLEEKQLEENELLKMYRAWRREIKQGLVDKYGGDFAELMRLLRNLHWTRAGEVVDHVRNAAWLLEADEGDRFATLRYIDESMMRARVRYGLSPLDDGLPGEEPSPMIVIRELLREAPHDKSKKSIGLGTSHRREAYEAGRRDEAELPGDHGRPEQGVPDVVQSQRRHRQGEARGSRARYSQRIRPQDEGLVEARTTRTETDHAVPQARTVRADLRTASKGGNPAGGGDPKPRPLQFPRSNDPRDRHRRA